MDTWMGTRTLNRWEKSSDDEASFEAIDKNWCRELLVDVGLIVTSSDKPPVEASL